MKLTELNHRLVCLYAEAKRNHEECVHATDEAERLARSQDPAAIVDSVYVLKRTAELLDESRKEINRKLEIIQKIGCLVAMQGDGERMIGQIAGGHADSGEQMILPDRDRDPQAYAALMRALGMPEEMVHNTMIKPSWGGVEKFVSGLAADGRPIPHGLESCKRIPRFVIAAQALSGRDIDTVASDLTERGQLDSSDNPF